MAAHVLPLTKINWILKYFPCASLSLQLNLICNVLKNSKMLSIGIFKSSFSDKHLEFEVYKLSTILKLNLGLQEKQLSACVEGNRGIWVFSRDL